RRLAEETPPGEEGDSEAAARGSGVQPARGAGRSRRRPRCSGGRPRGRLAFPPPPSAQCKEIGVKTCGACSRMLPDDVYSEKQRGMRQSSRRCEALIMIQKRVDAGDPVAMFHLGAKHENARYGLEKDVMRAIELYERAAVLGAKGANYNLAYLYAQGIDVEKDMAKAVRHYHEASAMSGDVSARYNLGCVEKDAGNHDLALQHWMISAEMGHDDSLTARGFQKATDGMSSSNRNEAKALRERDGS
ncbi:hypothetical protein THAOC_37514, partial [Thalassiosira oceanica]